MKKAINKISVKLIALGIACLLIAAMALPVMAADADSGYSYKITVFSGNQGTFAGGKTEVTLSAQYGERVVIDLNDLGLQLTNSKYYVKGLKQSGHDNSASYTTGMQSYSFEVTEDIAFVVGYGIAGDLVKYTVKYVDEQGKELLDQADYYGQPDDMPVVSYKYVEGYLPNKYNETKALSRNEAENVFVFVYHKVEQSQENSETETEAAPAGNQGNNGAGDTPAGENGNTGGGAAAEGGAGNAAPAGGNAAPAGGNAAPADDAVPADNAAPADDAQNGEEVTDPSVPAAVPGREGENIQDESGYENQAIIIEDDDVAKAVAKSGFPVGAWVGIGAGGAVIIALIIALIARSSKKKNT